jgi:hypothetical protein
VAAKGKAKVLSEEWLALVAEEGASLPPVEGVHARLQHDVAGGPDGEVSYVLTYADGRITEAHPGKGSDPDGTFAIPYKDAVEHALGEGSLLVAYMQGRAKYVGDVSKLLDLATVHQAPAFADFVARVAARSEA